MSRLGTKLCRLPNIITQFWRPRSCFGRGAVLAPVSVKPNQIKFIRGGKIWNKSCCPSYCFVSYSSPSDEFNLFWLYKNGRHGLSYVTFLIFSITKLKICMTKRHPGHHRPLCPVEFSINSQRALFYYFYFKESILPSRSYLWSDVWR